MHLVIQKQTRESDDWIDTFSLDSHSTLEEAISTIGHLQYTMGPAAFGTYRIIDRDAKADALPLATVLLDEHMVPRRLSTWQVDGRPHPHSA